MWVSAGRLEALPSDQCVATSDGSAVVVRAGDRVIAFQNECLHQASPLDGAIVRDGRLTCPLHFWRYEVPSRAHIGKRGTLPSYPVQIRDGEVMVEVPEKKKESIRDLMLRHAAEWERDK